MKEQVLAQKFKFTTCFFLAVFLTSLYFNIKALVSPFLIIHYPIIPDTVYSLSETINMMWSLKLYIVVCLIIGFSVIFPFVKLFALFYICFFMRKPRTRFWTITVIEALAKWSMLDVFIVCLILILTNNQYLLSSTPEIGVYYFLTAIFLSIVCSLIINSLCEKTYPDYVEKMDEILHFTSYNFSLFEKCVIIFFLIVSIVFFVLSITNNFIEISEFYLIPNAYSILESFVSLQNISYILATFVAIVLIVIPSIFYNSYFIFWTTAYHPSFHIKIMNFIKRLSKFMMLDVFCLSLFLFLFEGSVIIKTEYREGAYILVYFVFISIMLPLLIKYYAIMRMFFYKLKERKRDTVGKSVGLSPKNRE